MRGGLGYAVMMVLNPILILFYQNCSMVPTSKMQAGAKQPASVATKAQAAPGTMSANAKNLKECHGDKARCSKISE